MSSIPKAVIHINFLPGELLFDAQLIWIALNLVILSGLAAVKSFEKLSHFRQRNLLRLLARISSLSSSANTPILNGKRFYRP